MAKKINGRVTISQDILYSIQRTIEEAEEDSATNLSIELNIKDDKVVGGCVVGECTNQWSSNFDDNSGN